jgi:hypothetical protein
MDPGFRRDDDWGLVACTDVSRHSQVPRPSRPAQGAAAVAWGSVSPSCCGQQCAFAGTTIIRLSWRMRLCLCLPWYSGHARESSARSAARSSRQRFGDLLAHRSPDCRGDPVPSPQPLSRGERGSGAGMLVWSGLVLAAAAAAAAEVTWLPERRWREAAGQCTKWRWTIRSQQEDQQRATQPCRCRRCQPLQGMRHADDDGHDHDRDFEQRVHAQLNQRVTLNATHEAK